MKIEITADEKNPLYDRRDITAIATDIAATPARRDVVVELAKLAHAKEDCVVIERIQQRFGRKTAAINAKIYASPEKAKRFEKAYKFTRSEKKAAKKEGEAAAPAAPAAPAKAEAKKEENKEEKK